MVSFNKRTIAEGCLLIALPLPVLSAVRNHSTWPMRAFRAFSDEFCLGSGINVLREGRRLDGAIP